MTSQRPTGPGPGRARPLRAQEAELLAYRESLNPAAIGRQVADLQGVLLKLAKHKTKQLYLSNFPTALPDIRKGIRIKAS